MVIGAMMSHNPERATDLPDGIPAPADQIPSDFRMQLWAVDVVSFDMFDTLVQREGLFCPKDLFYRMQEQAESRYRIRLKNFVSVRVRAEGIARTRARGLHREEVTLEEIYVELAKILGLSELLAHDILNMELECERASLTALPHGKRLYEAALGAGKVVVVASDTYLSRFFLQTALDQTGYSRVQHIYASSEYGRTKHEGSLFDVILKELRCPPARLLHIGDNPLSDATAALSKGMRTLVLTNPKQRLRWRYGLGDTASGNTAVSTLLCEISRQSVGQTAFETDHRSALERSGVENLSWLYGGFSCWLVEQVKRHRHTRIYFASRDGLVMKRFFDLAAGVAGISVDSRYLYVSRAALYPTLVVTDPRTARRLFCHSWDHLTITEALKRMLLSYEEVAVQLARHGLADPHMPLDKVTASKLDGFLDAIWPSLLQKSEIHCDLVNGYLRQELFLTDEPAAFVDIGWHASLQHCLVMLLSHSRIEKRVHGYYLGTFALPDMSPKVEASGFLMENDKPAPISALIRSGPSLIELFHAAGHGSVLGYEHKANEVRPVLEQNEDELEQFKSTIEPLQNFAFEFVSTCLQRGMQPSVAMFPPDLVARLSLRPVQTPTEEEAEIFGRLKIATDFGGSMKSITGASEWDLLKVAGDRLPNGMRPMWYPGFFKLKQYAGTRNA